MLVVFCTPSSFWLEEARGSSGETSRKLCLWLVSWNILSNLMTTQSGSLKSDCRLYFPCFAYVLATSCTTLVFSALGASSVFQIFRSCLVREASSSAQKSVWENVYMFYHLISDFSFSQLRNDTERGGFSLILINILREKLTVWNLYIRVS